MSDQPNSQATNVIPRPARQSNLPTGVAWSAKRCIFTKEPELRGFLQLCADRRFHRCIQERFQEDTNMESPDLYWIHADAGGTPKMECARTAPDYCYHDKCVRLMGWSAHGNICGGFGDDIPDDEIQRALLVTALRKIDEYPEATHYIYFATAVKEGETWYAVVNSLICPGATG